MLKTTPKPCKICDSTYHQKFTCPFNRKPLSSRGKQSVKWYKTKVAWMKANDAATFVCHYCGKHLDKSETTLDHMKARSRAPELRYELDNLVPCCWGCNERKGSRDHDEIVHLCSN